MDLSRNAVSVLPTYYNLLNIFLERHCIIRQFHMLGNLIDNDKGAAIISASYCRNPAPYEKVIDDLVVLTYLSMLVFGFTVSQSSLTHEFEGKNGKPVLIQAKNFKYLGAAFYLIWRNIQIVRCAGLGLDR